MKKDKRKEMMLADIRYAKQNKDTSVGMLLTEMIVILILRDGYGWDKSEIKVFTEMIPKFLALYHFGKLSQDEIRELVDEIHRDIGVNLLEPILITEDMIK